MRAIVRQLNSEVTWVATLGVYTFGIAVCVQVLMVLLGATSVGHLTVGALTFQIVFLSGLLVILDE